MRNPDVSGFLGPVGDVYAPNGHPPAADQSDTPKARIHSVSIPTIKAIRDQVSSRR